MHIPRSRSLRAVVSSTGLAAVVAQLWQAAGSFGLQVLAARLLGASGLGTVSVCLGVIIVTTAVASGVVGDSLTVLDRFRPEIRAALLGWGLVLAALGGVVAGVGLVLTGLVEPRAGLAVGVAGVLFILEELARRILTATMRFWRLVLLDSSALVVSLGLIAVASRISDLSVTSFFLALAAGQAVGLVVGIALAPAAERWLPPLRGAAYRVVLGFGGWRGLQVAVNPTALTVLRMAVVAAAGTAALGTLEAARIFVAPATLAVQGFGSYLFASYARDRALPLSALFQRARRSSVWLGLGSLALGGATAVLAPTVGHLVTGPSFELAAGSVLAWAGYAAATASVQPFASLAAARGRQRAVLGIRTLDSLLGLLLLGTGLAWGRLPAAFAPVGLAVGLAIGGLLLRRLLVQMTVVSAEPGGSADYPTTNTLPRGQRSTAAVRA